jgi:hypothetical protein
MKSLKKQSGFIGVILIGVSMLVGVGLGGLIGNHPPKHDADQKVSVCKMNGSCVDNAADKE